MQERLAPGRTLIDVGANIGYFSLLGVAAGRRRRGASSPSRPLPARSPQLQRQPRAQRAAQRARSNASRPPPTAGSVHALRRARRTTAARPPRWRRRGAADVLSRRSRPGVPLGHCCDPAEVPRVRDGQDRRRGRRASPSLRGSRAGAARPAGRCGAGRRGVPRRGRPARSWSRCWPRHGFHAYRAGQRLPAGATCTSAERAAPAALARAADRAHRPGVLAHGRGALR